jgi:hypothetical protein
MTPAVFERLTVSPLMFFRLCCTSGAKMRLGAGTPLRPTALSIRQGVDLDQGNPGSVVHAADDGSVSAC